MSYWSATTAITWAEQNKQKGAAPDTKGRRRMTVMIKSRYTSAVCILIVCLMFVIAVLFTCGGSLGLTVSASTMAYESGLFATDRVHTMDIIVDEGDWQEMLDSASAKEYIPVSLVIDGSAVNNVGLRTKGNSSLTSIVSSDSDRYSFKVEFDHYATAQTFQGLDKLALNNIAQDNTYLKDYICYQLMESFGADAPLCSFINITVNGTEWGLYLAVEGIEESFAERNYGGNYGQIYKPDSMDMAGGMGGDREIMPDMAGIEEGFGGMFEEGEMPDFSQFAPSGDGNDETGGGMVPGGDNAVPEENGSQETPSDGGTETPEEDSGDSIPGAGAEGFTMPEGAQQGGRGRRYGRLRRRSQDVALQYIDDDPDSYSNIFDNAAFDIGNSDKNRLIDTLEQLGSGENLEEIVNIEEVLRYFVVHNFVLNFDSYTGSMTHNYYLYEDAGQLSMIAWDYNLSFGAFAMGGGFGGSESTIDQATTMANYPIDTPVSGVEMEDRPLLNQLLSDETYLERYHALFSEFIGTYFDEGFFYEIYENAYELIKPYVEQDPTSFCTYEEFETAVQMLKEFCTLRAEGVSLQLDGTVPSTTDGQAQDSSGFVDAGSIDIASMGSNSMGFDKARGSFGGENTRQRPDMGTASGGTAPDETQTPESAVSGDTQDVSAAILPDATVSVLSLSAAADPAAGIHLTQLSATPGRGMTEGGTGEPSAGGAMPGNGEMPGGNPPEGMEGFDGEGIPEGFARGEMPENAAGQSPDTAVPAEGESSSENPEEDQTQAQNGQQPDTGENGEAQQENGAGMQNFGGMDMGNMMGNRTAAATQSSDTEKYLWLGVSVLILVAGLIVAKLYRV